MARPQTWMRFFSYAVIGVAAGYMLFASTSLGIELAVLFACAVVVGLVFHYRRRADLIQPPPSTEAKNVGVASDEEFLRERWRQDLDYEAAGVRNPAVPSLDWGPLGQDATPEDLDRIGRD